MPFSIRDEGITEQKKQAQWLAPDETDINARQAHHNTHWMKHELKCGLAM
jgi:hypothetical protein